MEVRSGSRDELAITEAARHAAAQLTAAEGPSNRVGGSAVNPMGLQGGSEVAPEPTSAAKEMASEPATPAKPPRVTKRRAETRARLIDAAYQVFVELGFGHVRIEDVVEAAGYTRGAFYSQFESLDELFFILYDNWASRVVEQVATIVEGAEPADVPVIVERVVGTVLLDRDWLLLKTDFLAHAARRPGLAQRWSEHRAHLRDAIEQHLSVTGFELHDAFGTAADAALAIVAVYDGVATQLLLDNDQAAARAWLAQLLRVLLTPSSDKPKDPRFACPDSPEG